VKSYLLNGCVVANLAGKLPTHLCELGNFRSHTVGNNKMENASIQFYLRENKRELDCLLIIFGNEQRKKEIVEKINDEIKFDHSWAILLTQTIIIVYEGKVCVFDVYNWTENLKRMMEIKPKAYFLKS